MSFKNFLQNGPINEGLFSNLFGNGKKKPERPQTAVGKNKEAYRTHDDIDPDDIPVFKPSFTVKKEEEIEEGEPLTNRKIKKASVTSSKTGNFAKVDHYVKSNDERNVAYTTKNFKKTVKEEGLTKQMRQKGYNGPRVGDDRHLTFTKKGNKNDQVLVDLPGKEWHAMKDGVVKKVGKIKEEISPLLKIKHLGTRLDEGRARLSKDSKMNDGKNRKVRKAQKQAADTNVKLGHNFLAKVSYQRKRQKARERNSPRMTQNTGSVN
jgi:ribosomal protein S21